MLGAIKKMEYRNSMLVLLSIFIVGCKIFDESTNELIIEHYNPSQNLKVIVFEKLGNATTNNSLQITLNRYNYELKNSDTGNIFIADGIEGLNNPKDSLVLVSWLSNDTLEINYPPSFRTLKMEEMLETEFGKVIIKYDDSSK